MEFITGSAKETRWSLKEAELLKNCNIHYHEYFWLSKTYSSILMHDPNIILHDNIYSNFLYTFTSLNLKPRYHRCLIMDLLSKYNLIDTNAITWHQKERATHTEPMPLDYNFKYWKPKPLTLTEEDTRSFSIHVPPIEYKNSFCQLVIETSSNIPFITEKTAIPLYRMKPFLIAGCKGFHKILQRMGFELYTEIFDYSFDSIESDAARFEAIVQNFARINFLSLSELTKIYQKLYDKLLFNKHHAIKLATSLSEQPSIINEVYQETKYRKGLFEDDFNRIYLNYS